MTKQERTERERVCAMLQAFGVEASLAPRGRREERCQDYSLIPLDDSEGLIDIQASVIRWVNVWGHPPGDGGTVLDYGVPDVRPLPRLEDYLSSVRVKNFPILGRVIDVRWKGDDHGTGIVNSLTADDAIKKAIMCIGGYGHDPYVWSCPEHGCWLMREPIYDITTEKWDCFEKIAARLLATPLKERRT